MGPPDGVRSHNAHTTAQAPAAPGAGPDVSRGPQVRALYRASCLEAAPPPYDRVFSRIYYPAEYGGSAEERNTGLLPARSEGAPFPVLIMFPGINVGPEHYTWLARVLAANNIVFLSFSCVAEELPGHVGLSPGLDLDALTPGSYGKKSSATCLPGLLNELEALNRDGVLAGRLDLDSIILGGHSAGGSVALFNARKQWCPGLKACFAYGAHAGAATMLGWPEHSLFGLPGEAPTLLIGGENDGVIAASGGRYGSETDDPTTIMERSFDEALRSTRGDSWLAILRGANHFSFAWPRDECSGRLFLDGEERQPGATLRRTILDLLLDFIGAGVLGSDEAGKRLRARAGDDAFSVYRNR